MDARPNQGHPSDLKRNSTMVMLLHGNQYLRRGNVYPLVDIPLAPFAEGDVLTPDILHDFQKRSAGNNDWALFQHERPAREEFQSKAVENHWGMIVVAPILQQQGPWSPSDLCAFAKAMRERFKTQGICLVGVSTGGMAALRTLEFAGLSKAPSPFSAIAVVSPGCPRDGRPPNAGFKADPLCTAPPALPPSSAVKSLAMTLRNTRVPILIYQGTEDNRARPAFALSLQREVNGREFGPKEAVGERIRSVQVWVRLLQGAGHTSRTWSRALLFDTSAYSWLMRHSSGSPFSREGLKGVTETWGDFPLDLDRGGGGGHQRRPMGPRRKFRDRPGHGPGSLS